MKKTLILFLAILTMALLVAAPAWAEVTGAPTSVIPIDLTPLFQAVIALLATIVTVKVVPWIKQRTTAEQQARLNAMTRTLVFAAEQMYNTGQIKDKLWYVKGELAARGFIVDVDAIEAAVREMSMGGKQAVADP